MTCLVRLTLCSVLLAAVCGCFLGCGVSSPSVMSTQHPLVAEYVVPTDRSGTVSVQFGTDTTYGRQTASYPVLPGTATIQVAGMMPSTTYHMQAQIKSGGSVVWSDKDRVFTTGAIPTPQPAPSLTVTRTTDPMLAASENPGVESVVFFPTSANPAIQAMVTDRNGVPLWYYAPPFEAPQFFKVMPNGHVLVCVLNQTSGSPDYILREIDLSGRTIRELHLADLNTQLVALGYNANLTTISHDFVPMENGHTVILCTDNQNFDNLPGYPGTTSVIGDVLIDLDPNWNPVWFWSGFDHLKVTRHPMFFPDWTHSNALLYNPNDGNLMLSMRHQSWIIYIDYANGTGAGDILWTLGYQGDFTLSSNDPSQWFSAQHYPSFINIAGSQMTLAIFDNGDYRQAMGGSNCGNTPYPACYSRATVFQLDQEAKTAQLNWAYLPGFYSFWGGTATQLPNGNIEFEMSEPFPIPTTGSRAMEVSQTGSPEIVWQMDITGGFSYRTYRIPSLYYGVSWQN